MRISTAVGLVYIGLLIEAVKETEENKKGEDKNAKRKTSKESLT
jgi:hypothetical protein